MNTSLASLFFIFFFSIQILAQNHISPCNGAQDHTTGICYGYAMGRAAGRIAGDSDCDPLTFHKGEIDTRYFNYYEGISLYGLQQGDIIKFEQDHVAYVASIGNPMGETRVDHYLVNGGGQKMNDKLNEVTGFGAWTGYYRREKIDMTVKNNFQGGDVKINDISKSAGSQIVDWWYLQTLEAIDEQNILDPADGNYYTRVFQYWVKPNQNQDYNLSISVIPKFGQTYTAVFKKEFNVTVQNSFVGVNDPGKIIVNGDTLDGGTTIQVIETQDVIIEAPDQIDNGIHYTFDHWYDGSTQNPRTFTITSHFNPVAHYKGKPTQVTNRNYVNIIWGDPIQFTWAEQPNPNVSKYYIFRKVKDSISGQSWGPTLIATLNRGTLSYTDDMYSYTNGYTKYLIWYDVRPYYSVEQSYADSNYMAVFGGLPPPKAIDDYKDKQILSNGNTTPKDFDLFQNYPNPFNPTTQIKYALKENGFVTIKVYDVLGKAVATLVNENKPAGFYTVNFDASNLCSGIYFYTIKTNDFFDRKKMIVLK
jgi:hypothetical protein